jgi:hypothetical protein
MWQNNARHAQQFRHQHDPQEFVEAGVSVLTEDEWFELIGERR